MQSSNKPALIISTCGISLATNTIRMLNKNYPPRFLIYKYANETSLSEIKEKQVLRKVSNDVMKTITQATISEQCKLSAELNALWRFYDNQPEQYSGDMHYLIHTDTWLGEEVAKALQEAMGRRDLVVNTQKIDELRTSSLEDFRNGIGGLIGFLESTLESYKNSHRIVFNLSGGFKSIQGVMQSLASIYADEVIYIFESSDALLRLPRLPMTLDWEEITSYSINLRRLALDLTIDTNHRPLPTIFLYHFESKEVILSEWGDLIAKRSKKELYTKGLLPTPSKKIHYGNKFERSLSGIDKKRIKQINERIDDLAIYLETGKKLKRLDFKDLKGKDHSGSTHEIDAWADGAAERIFCHYDHGVIVLDVLGKALH